MATATIPPLVLLDPKDNPEHYEFLQGQWKRKTSVGGKEHSVMGRTLRAMLRPIAKSLGCQVEQEWTVIENEKKIIPDVTFSHRSPEIRNGYLVAPALLAVESRCLGQTLQSLVEKCVMDNHLMGTRYCWIIDIDARSAYECHLGEREARKVENLSAGDLFSLPVEALFSKFDEALEG